jgi:thiol-disulfide isomerase/thioredoxin
VKHSETGSALVERFMESAPRVSGPAPEEPPVQRSAIHPKPRIELRPAAARHTESVASSAPEPTGLRMVAKSMGPRPVPTSTPVQPPTPAKVDKEKEDAPTLAAPSQTPAAQSSSANVDLAEMLPEKIDDAVAKILDEWQQKDSQFAADKAQTTDPAKLKSLLKHDPAKSAASQLLELGEKEPTSKTGYQAFVATLYVVRDSDADLTADVVDRATKHLAADHLKDEGLGKAALLAASLPQRGARRLLQTVLDKSPHRDVRGLACFALVKSLESERDQTADPTGHKRIDKQVAKLVRRIDQQEFGDVTVRDQPLAEALKALTARKPQLALGSVAPEIVGKDLDGSRLKLSDYRGKVVMLVFWANWCPYCRRLIPYERDLVDKMRDRPFALLGVNVDKRAEAAAVQRKKLTNWRSWQDGPSGPIGAKWQIKGYPTVYVLDRKGTLRFTTGYTPDANYYNQIIEAAMADGEPKSRSKSARGDQLSSRASAEK